VALAAVKEFVEVESGKKTDRHRPVLAEAIKACRLAQSSSSLTLIG
jgi:DNA invertase Pin-like site-specific DNA recombinase